MARTQEQWEKYNLPKVIAGFSPRLRRDLSMGYSPRVPMPDFGSYYIYGPVGSGKTVLAAQMFIEAKRRQYFERLPGQYLFVNSYDFFEDLKKSFDDPHMDGHAILAQFSNAEYLVLDDLGSVRFTE